MRLVASLIVVSLLALASQLLAQPVLVGVPDTRVSASPDQSAEQVLDEVARSQNVVVIERCGGDFCWATRGDDLMVRRTSGIYDIYVSVGGAGYVKVQNPIGEDDPVLFLEHVHLGLSTITYFGVASAYNPPG